MAIEACRLALKYMTPVILLTDSYLANGSELWRIPAMKDMPDMAELQEMMGQGGPGAPGGQLPGGFNPPR